MEILEVRSNIISYGRDIEASWFLFEASELLGNKSNKLFFENNAVGMANAALSGVDKDGGMWYEYDSVSRHYYKEKHWWDSLMFTRFRVFQYIFSILKIVGII